MDTIDDKVDPGKIVFPRAIIPAELRTIVDHIAATKRFRIGVREERYTNVEPNRDRNGVSVREDTPKLFGHMMRLFDVTSVEFSVMGRYDDHNNYQITGVQLSIPGSDIDEYDRRQVETMDTIKEAVTKYFADREIKP